MKYSLFITLLASTAVISLASARSETLRESVDQAIAAHPSIESALAGREITKEDRLEARSGLFPTISANTSAGRIYGDNSTSRGLTVSRGAAYSGLWEGSAALTQPLYDGSQTLNRMDAAQARYLSSDFDVLDVKENLAFQAVQAHIAVMQAQATLNKTKSYYAVIEDYLNRIQLMVDEGVADESELSQAKNISLMLKSTVIDYEGQLNSALAAYQEIIGRAPTGELQKPIAPHQLIAENVEATIQRALNTHPLMLSGQKELEAIGYDVKAEKGSILPTLDGEISYLKRDQKEEIGGEVQDARALLKMRWDFETGGAQGARERRSQAQYSEIQAQNREAARIIEGDIRRAYAEYETAQKQMELVQKREVVTKELFNAYEVQFEGARVRLLQLMQAENQLFNAQLESIASEYRYLLAQYSILASSGVLLESLSSMPTLSTESISSSVSLTVPELVEKEIISTVVDLDDKIYEPSK